MNGGGGKGVVFGKQSETEQLYGRSNEIRGIYDGCLSEDGRGSVIAMNFKQTLNAQRFQPYMTDPIVCTAVGCFEYLPEKWKEQFENFGYAVDGKPNFAVYSNREYEALYEILKERIDIVTELNHKTLEIASSITADLAPTHVRKDAEYVGAILYRFNALGHFVGALYDMNWLKDVKDSEKPAICVVNNM